MIRIARYNRFWAVWCGSDLIAVVVYKKGAEAVATIARKLEGRP